MTIQTTPFQLVILGGAQTLGRLTQGNRILAEILVDEMIWEWGDEEGDEDVPYYNWPDRAKYQLFQILDGVDWEDASYMDPDDLPPYGENIY